MRKVLRVVVIIALYFAAMIATMVLGHFLTLTPNFGY